MSWFGWLFGGGGSTGGDEEECRAPVYVHVYHLGNSYITWGLNKITDYGAFHTGVEVYGREWSFGHTGTIGAPGICEDPPKGNPDHTYRETLAMGITLNSPDEVLEIIEEMQKEWLGISYDLLNRNCHHFSHEFCCKLGVAGLPDWINTLAGTGSATVDFLETRDSGYDGGQGLVDLFSSWGRTLAGGSSSDEEEEETPHRTPVRHR